MLEIGTTSNDVPLSGPVCLIYKPFPYSIDLDFLIWPQQVLALLICKWNKDKKSVHAI